MRRWLLPAHQRRTLDELTDELELRSGDTRAKQSAFWTMLTLSAVIATAGVLADSTATVIGAMIIAPLSTPIMGMALASVKGRRNGSALFVLVGGCLVIAVGALFSRLLPDPSVLTENSQVAGRIAPGLLDLVAALATGLAGAVALARRDVAAVLPGVAIAISLVPPLAVVGVCLGQGLVLPALGALLLFASNLVALVVAGVFVFAVLGYRAEAPARRSTRSRLGLVASFVLVLVPLAVTTSVTWVLRSLTDEVEAATKAWVATEPSAEVERVDLAGAHFRVEVRAPGDLPPIEQLRRELAARVPSGVRVDVVRTSGEVLTVETP